MDEKLLRAADELLNSVREVEMEFKDHRADDDFERMLAELNGQKSEQKPSEKAPDEPAKASDTPVKEQQSDAAEKPLETEKPSDTEKADAKSEDKPKTDKKQLPRPQKTPEQLKQEQKKKKEAEARRQDAAVEQARKKREAELVKQLTDIWDNPALADGGRVSMTIKTEQRKAIRITIPPEVRRKAAMEQALSEKQAEAAKKPELQSVFDKPAPQQVEPVIKSDESKSKSEPAAAAAETASASEKKPDIAKHDSSESAPKQPLQKQESAEQAKAVPAYAAAATAIPTVSVTPPAPPIEHIPPQPSETAKTPDRNAEKPAAAESLPKQMKPSAAVAENTRVSKLSVANVIVCCTMFFGFGLFLLFCHRESGFINSENRYLAEKPKLTVEALLDGSYFTDITKWYTDTIPGREELKPISSRIKRMFGITLDDVKITGDITPAVKETLDSSAPVTTTEVTLNTDFTKTESAATTTKKKKKTTEKLADVPDNLTDGVWMGSVIVSGRGENVRAMSAFGGTFGMGKKYADTLNKYRETLGDSINIYTMNIPLSSAYYLPDSFKNNYTSQHDFITNIANDLVGVMNIDVFDALEAHTDEYIYSRTDHHWQPLGAYYAAQVFASRAQFDFPDLSTYTECRIENFVGTMYAYSNYDEDIKNNPDTFIYHKPDNAGSLTVTHYSPTFTNPVRSMLFHDYASGVNCYSAILGGDNMIAEIDTDVHNNRVLVIIKDSFGNALVPYLTHGFERIYVVDFRYFDINGEDFIHEVGATDLLFAVSLASAYTESHINLIGNLRIQGQTPEEVLPPETPDSSMPDENSNGDGGEESSEESSDSEAYTEDESSDTDDPYYGE